MDIEAQTLVTTQDDSTFRESSQSPTREPQINSASPIQLTELGNLEQ